MALGWDFFSSATLAATFGLVFFMAGGSCYELSFRFEVFGWYFSPEARFRFSRRYLIFSGVLLLALVLASYTSMALTGRLFGDGLFRILPAVCTAPLAGWLFTALVYKLKSPTTARYAADLFGRQEVEDHKGMVKESYAVTPDQFQSLPEPSPTTGSYGYYSTMFASFPGFIPGYQATRELLPAAADFPNFVARDDKHQYLEPLTAEERKRFRLPAQKQRQAAEAAKKDPEGKRRDDNQASDSERKPKPPTGGRRFRYPTKGGTALHAVDDDEPLPELPEE
jgi:hypothetical protein